jgi:ATP-binding cassette, subfamily B, bacterial
VAILTRLLTRRDNSESALGPTEMARRVKVLVPDVYRRLGRQAAISFVGSVFEAALLVLMARIAVSATEADEPHVPLLPGDGAQVTIPAAVLVALVLLVGKVITGTMVARGSAEMATKGLTDVRLALLRSYIDADWSVQSTERQGDLQELMTTHADRTTGVNMSLSMFLTSSLNVVVLVITAIVVNPIAAAALILTGSALAGSMRPLAAAGRRNSARQAAVGREFASAVAELVSVARELRVFSTGPAALEKIEPIHDKQARYYRRSRFLMILSPQLFQSAGLLVLIVGIGIVSVTTSSSVAGIGAVVLLLLRALGYGQQTQLAYQALNDSVPYLDQVRAQRDRYLDNPAKSGTRPVTSIGRLELDNVVHEYLEGRPVLNGLSAVVEKGEAVGIVGPSGSGKSTLLQILLRLREPTDGRYLVDGVDARELDLASWYQRLAFVPQDPHLIEGTVAENIAFYRDIPLPMLRKAAEMAQIATDIEALPHGFDELIGPEDTTLSGGQQQRLTIARALAGEPDLLVLDEPTSALDMRSEARLQETLHTIRGQVTLVVVAHRLSTIATCDRIMVVAKGQIQGFDRHEELVSSSKFYEEMLQMSVLQQTPAGGAT